MSNAKFIIVVVCIFLQLSKGKQVTLIVDDTEEKQHFVDEIVVQSQAIRPQDKPTKTPGWLAASFGVPLPDNENQVPKKPVEIISDANIQLNRETIKKENKGSGTFTASFSDPVLNIKNDSPKKDSNIVRIKKLAVKKDYEFKPKESDEDVLSEAGYTASVKYLSEIIKHFREMQEEVNFYQSTPSINDEDIFNDYFEGHIEETLEDDWPMKIKLRLDRYTIDLPIGDQEHDMQFNREIEEWHKENEDDYIIKADDTKPSTVNKDGQELEDYRIELQENLLKAAKVESRAWCTSPGPMCDTCSTAATCVDQGDGHYEKHIIAKCPNGTYCLNGTCSLAANPQCDGSVNMAFPCTSTGMYPDPFYCALYHFCPPPVPARVTANCAINFAYNPASTFCDIPVGRASTCSDGYNGAYPVPLCHGAGQSGSVPGAPSLYYLCKAHNKKLYPFVYKCPRGALYVKTKCVPKNATASKN